jgi:hypothetical protein
MFFPDLIKDREMIEFINRFASIFRVGIAFPMHEILVLLRFFVKGTVKDSLGYILAFSSTMIAGASC